MEDQVLILTPSAGLGGGIERYAETIEWALSSNEIDSHRIDLHKAARQARLSAHAQMYAACAKFLQRTPGWTHLVLIHRALLPVAVLLAKRYRICGVSVVCHGNDVWSAKSHFRRRVENKLLKMRNVRLVANSQFTAGAMATLGEATILPPGLSRDWFHTLVEASKNSRPHDTTINIVTAFSLARWREKGLRELLIAVASMERADINVTVCGAGNPPRELLQLVQEHRRCFLRIDLPPSELARQFAAADIFVLATQAGTGENRFFESFGLVLVEAQLAGTPVVAPAYGGSRDAIIAGRTGVIPADQSPEALAKALEELLKNPQKIREMGKLAGEWASELFSPEQYASHAVDALL